MMIYMNYEEAQHVFDSADPKAKAIVERVNSFMISDEMRFSDLRPLYAFDMCFFYQSLLRAVGSYIAQDVHSGLRDVPAVMAVHFPDFTVPSWGQCDFVACGLAKKYVDQIRAQSVPSGCQFDVGFACAVASKSIDNQFLADLRSPTHCFETKDDFESWLSGFNK